MDDPFLREELARAFALDDAARADYAQWKAKQTPRVEKQYDGRGLIYETHENEMPPQQQAAPTMTPEQQVPWDSWVRAHIKRELALEPFNEVQEEILVHFVCEYVGERLKDETAKLREEIAALRADLSIQTGVARGEIAEIKKRKRDVA